MYISSISSCSGPLLIGCFKIIYNVYNFFRSQLKSSVLMDTFKFPTARWDCANKVSHTHLHTHCRSHRSGGGGGGEDVAASAQYDGYQSAWCQVSLSSRIHTKLHTARRQSNTHSSGVHICSPSTLLLPLPPPPMVALFSVETPYGVYHNLYGVIIATGS